MGFSVSGNYPIIEMMMSNSPIAAIFIKGPNTKFIKIKPILNKFFVCKYGWFYLDDSMKISVGKTPVYYYTGNHVKPLNPMAIKDIQIYLKKNKKAELSQLEEWVEEQFTRQEEADYKQMERDQPRPEDQTGEFDLIEEHKPQQIEPTIETRRTLRQLREPINWNVENFLSSYNRCDPQSFRIAIKEIKGAKKQLDTMESKPIKAAIPITVFAMVAVAIMIGMSQGPQIMSSLSGLTNSLDIGGLGQWTNTDFQNLPDPFTPDPEPPEDIETPPEDIETPPEDIETPPEDDVQYDEFGEPIINP